MAINIISTEEVWTSRNGKSPLFGTQEWQQVSEMLLHRRLQPGETVRVELSKETRGLVKHADRLMRNLLIERFSHGHGRADERSCNLCEIHRPGVLSH
jgi:hypothetical protein